MKAIILKQILLPLILGLVTFSAFARPQLQTSSIGWIDRNSIFCEETSDHTCRVKQKTHTFVGQNANTKKYTVPAGTELVIRNEGSKRANVGIVIPADWRKDGNLHPNRPCQLSRTGQFPQVVKLACK